MSTGSASARRRRSPEARSRLGLVEMGRALGHARRIKIMMLLLESTTELSSTDLANLLDTSVNKIDHHVKCLLVLGLIESKRTRQGLGACQHFYVLVPAAQEFFEAVVEHPLPLSTQNPTCRSIAGSPSASTASADSGPSLL